jgi:S-phase kinase-associated protein 1
LKVWDEKFVRLEPGELCELASAAYHLEIKPLVDLTCKAIAKLLKGKPPAEIRRTFNILYDFSPGDDVPPPTTRDKLRTKLHNKQKEKNSSNKLLENTPVDTRSVEELVSFIDGSSKSKKKAQKNKKTKPTTTLAANNESPITKTKPESQNSKDQSQNLISPKKNKELYALIMNDISEDFWETEDPELDPELKAAQDKEVEEFRLRLESIQRNDERPKINIPSFDTSKV